jgi:hypothetical protein
MKRIYLLIIALCVTGAVSAQSLQLSGITITGDPAWLLEGRAIVENVSSSPVDVIVERVVDNTFPGHVSYFCWVQCYASFISVSPDHISLMPGDTTSSFRGDLEPSGITGISEVSYCFYDKNNIADSVCVKYTYSGTTGLEDIPANKNFVSKPYPNPATDHVSFSYNLANAGSNAELRFFNMLGSQVKSIVLNDTRGTQKININELKSGLYFYTLFVDGKNISSNKLMINKN